MEAGDDGSTAAWRRVVMVVVVEVMVGLVMDFRSCIQAGEGLRHTAN